MLGLDDDRVEYLLVLLEVRTLFNAVARDLGELAVDVDERAVVLFDVVAVNKVVALLEGLVEELRHRDDLVLLEHLNFGRHGAIADLVESGLEARLLRVGLLEVLEFVAHLEEDLLDCAIELVEFGVFVIRLVEHDALEHDVQDAVAKRVGEGNDGVELAAVRLALVRDIEADEDLQPLFRVILDEVAHCNEVGAVHGVLKPGGADDVVLDVVERVLLLLEHVLFRDEHEEQVLAVFDQPLLELGDQRLVLVH